MLSMRIAIDFACRRALWVLGHAGTLLGCPPWAAFLRHAQAQGCLFAAMQPFDGLFAAGGLGRAPAALPPAPKPSQGAVKRSAASPPQPEGNQRRSRAAAGAHAQAEERTLHERSGAGAAGIAAQKRSAGGDSSEQRPAKRGKPLAAAAPVEGPVRRRDESAPGQSRAVAGAGALACHAAANIGRIASAERDAPNTDGGSASVGAPAAAGKTAELGAGPLNHNKNPKVTAFANPMLALRSLPSADVLNIDRRPK